MSSSKDTPRTRHSSTTRSIRSTTSTTYRTPRWQASSFLKATPSVSVASVFAQSEHGAPLESASESVSLSSPSTSSSSGSAGPSRLREVVSQLEETLEGDDEANRTLAAQDKAEPTMAIPSTNTNTQKLRPNPSLPNLRPSRPQQTSWFSSLTRSKGKMAMQTIDPDLAASTNPATKVGDATLAASPETTAPPPMALQVEPPTPVVIQEPNVAPTQPILDASTLEQAPPQPLVKSPPLPIPSVAHRQTATTKRSWFGSGSNTPISSSPNRPCAATSTSPIAPGLPPPPPGPSSSITVDLNDETDRTFSLSESPDSGPTPPIYAPQPTHLPVAYSPPHPAPPPPPARTLSLPSSIDDRVPSLPPTPPAHQLTTPMPTLQSPPRSPTPVSLNPSSSRFTLSMPLLGRAKVPLGSVFGLSGEVKHSKDSQVGSSAVTSTTAPKLLAASSEATATISMSPTTTTTTPTVADVPDSTTEPTTDSNTPAPTPMLTPLPLNLPTPYANNLTISSPDLAAPGMSVSTSKDPQNQQRGREARPSWWGYVGWTSPSTTNTIVQPSGDLSELTGEIHRAPEGDVAASETQDAEQKEEQAEARLLEAVAQVWGPEVVVGDDSRNDGVEVETAGMTKEEGTPVPTAAWLMPWSWYYSSSTATTTLELGAGEGGEGKGPAVGEKTEVRSQAKDSSTIEEGDNTSAPTLTETQPPASTTATPAAEPETNPITQTFESNKSGWASFFSSKALVVKTLSYKTPLLVEGKPEDRVERDESGAEVMDLDEDELEALGSGGSAGVMETTKTKAATVAKEGSPPMKTKNSTSSEGSNTSTTSASTASGKKIVSAPPIIISEDVKRSASTTPTPRKGRSGRNTPINVPPSPTPSMNTTLEKDKVETVATTTSTTTSTTASSGSTATTTPKTSTMTSKKPASAPATPAAQAPYNKRIPSPAPSTTSSKSPSSSSKTTKDKPPSAPPPPNVVLPTWEHTFHAAPRNVLPPKPATYVDDQGVGGRLPLFGRTMKFVSGVLGGSGLVAASGGGAGVGGAGDAPAAGWKGKERAREGSTTREREAGEGGESLIERDRRERFREFGKELPKAWKVLEDAGWDTSGDSLRWGAPSTSSARVGGSVAEPGTGTKGGKGSSASTSVVVGMESEMKNVLRGCRRVVVIGVHGWFPGAMIRTMLGEPTGTSVKFANMMEQALQEFETEHGVKFEKITKIPLEGDGTISKRVEKLYTNLLANEAWVSALHEADAILVSTHSQGSIVCAHLLDRLMADNHITTTRNQLHTNPLGRGAEVVPSAVGMTETQRRKVQRVCCLAMCGIHLGPLRYLSSSTLVGPYLQYFESMAARELFEFQNTESAVSTEYVKALQNVLDHGTKMVYVASLNDQVVPIYSGLFTAVSHPLILRSLYIDGDAYHSSDFLSNLLVLLLRILNSGISDSGLLAHLSEATAGSLNGVGHSTAYEELATYSLAVKYLFLTNEGMHEHAPMALEHFNATNEQNDYEIPWSLRDIIANERVAYFFGQEITELRDAFREWHPKTTILRDLKRKLQPIQRLPSTFSAGTSTSKL